MKEKMRLNWANIFGMVALLFLLARLLFFKEGPAYTNLIVAAPCLVASIFGFKAGIKNLASGKKMVFFPAVVFFFLFVLGVIDFFG